MAYQAKGTYDDEEIKRKNKNDYLAIQAAKNRYVQAQKRGDEAGMEAAHAEAERVRSRYGYSGGEDGSERLKQGGQSLPGAGLQKPRPGISHNYTDMVEKLYQQAGQAADNKLRLETELRRKEAEQRARKAQELRDDGARQAAVLREQMKRDLPYQLSRAGITGGAAETTTLGVEQSYADRLRQLDKSYAEKLAREEDNLDRDRIRELMQRGDLYAQLARSLVPDYLTAMRYEENQRLDQQDREDNVYQQQLALAAQLAKYGDFSIYEQMGADVGALRRYFENQNG